MAMFSDDVFFRRGGPPGEPDRLSGPHRLLERGVDGRAAVRRRRRARRRRRGRLSAGARVVPGSVWLGAHCSDHSTILRRQFDQNFEHDVFAITRKVPQNVPNGRIQNVKSEGSVCVVCTKW